MTSDNLPVLPWQSRIVSTEEVDPRSLQAHPMNFRGHPDAQREALSEVLDRVGWIQRVIVNRRTGRMIDGHLRAELAIERGEKTIPVEFVDVSDEEERLILATFDGITGMASRDNAMLSDLLASLPRFDDQPRLQNYLDDYLDQVQAAQTALEATSERLALTGARPSQRQYALDAIFTLGEATSPAVWTAYRSGFKLGVRSSASNRKDFALWNTYIPLTFLDQEFKAYDHAHHLEVTARMKPKYVTVRDLMTRRQCDDAGIAYYSYDQIMRFAEDLAKHAENVIVIPKFDCIDDIPAQYMLGYSVPSSYGATELPIDRFRGRRVHLLGGAWKTQLAYLSALGDDIVSFDTNWINAISQYGHFVYPDGSTKQVGELGLPVNNVKYVALSISLGNIGRAVYDLYTNPDLAPDSLEEGEVSDIDGSPTRGA